MPTKPLEGFAAIHWDHCHICQVEVNKGKSGREERRRERWGINWNLGMDLKKQSDFSSQRRWGLFLNGFSRIIQPEWIFYLRQHLHFCVRYHLRSRGTLATFNLKKWTQVKSRVIKEFSTTRY